MSEVAGLLVLTSNYGIADVVETDSELKIVTNAVIQTAEITKLQNLGWELVEPNVVVYRNIRGDGPSPIVDEIIDAPDDGPVSDRSPEKFG